MIQNPQICSLLYSPDLLSQGYHLRRGQAGWPSWEYHPGSHLEQHLHLSVFQNQGAYSTLLQQSPHSSLTLWPSSSTKGASWVLGAGVQTMGRWLPHPQSSSSLCQHPTSHTPTGLLENQNSHRPTQAVPRGGLWGQSLNIRSAFCKLRESHFTFPYLGFPTYNDKNQLVWLM